ncbi:MAG: DUF6183 family protein [Ilumatobacteraceae bacterium]|nr:DUF6183 family protein [Ilumatobacteraceae bacterium]
MTEPVDDRELDDQDLDDQELDDLIRVVDLDGLVRMVDARCDADDWAGLLRLRDRCAAATIETGRQLWPAATLAEYRLALLAPDEWAATVLDGESGRFTIGPLSEVTAVRHTWAGLAPHLDTVPIATFIAHERAIRGEHIPPGELTALPPVLDIPADLQPWEPAYPVSTYTDAGAEHPEPDATGDLVDVTTPDDVTIVDDDSTELAVRQLLEAWTAASTGRAETVCVEGDHLAALSALGVRSARVAEIPAAEAVARLAWAGASGGAQGRRRGMAIGRFSAWWLLGAIGDLHDDWPPTDDEIAELLANLRWFRWDAHEPAGGWRLQLVVEDHAEGLAWAINAADHD